jgi:hypothetical protein
MLLDFHGHLNDFEITIGRNLDIRDGIVTKKPIEFAQFFLNPLLHQVTDPYTFAVDINLHVARSLLILDDSKA